MTVGTIINTLRKIEPRIKIHFYTLLVHKELSHLSHYVCTEEAFPSQILRVLRLSDTGPSGKWQPCSAVPRTKLLHHQPLNSLSHYARLVQFAWNVVAHSGGNCRLWSTLQPDACCLRLLTDVLCIWPHVWVIYPTVYCFSLCLLTKSAACCPRLKLNICCPLLAVYWYKSICGVWCLKSSSWFRCPLAKPSYLMLEISSDKLLKYNVRKRIV